MTTIGIKEQYVKKLFDKEVNGPNILLMRNCGDKIRPFSFNLSKSFKQEHPERNNVLSGKETKLD